MEAAEIKQIVKDEISKNQDRISQTAKAFLEQCLVAPTKEVYEEFGKEKKAIELWLVLDSSYQIVFGETENLFGLATIESSTNKKIFLGFYGTFFETLEAM